VLAVGAPPDDIELACGGRVYTCQRISMQAAQLALLGTHVSERSAVSARQRGVQITLLGAA
jgi:hypothetical protein